MAEIEMFRNVGDPAAFVAEVAALLGAALADYEAGLLAWLEDTWQ